MPNLLVDRMSHTSQPDLQQTSSSSSSTTSSFSAPFDENNNEAYKTSASLVASSTTNMPRHNYHKNDHNVDTEELVSIEDTCATGWSQQEQEEFISLMLPHIDGKQLTEEEIRLIRQEAQQANVPEECVDRLLNVSRKTYRQHIKEQKQILEKYKSKDFESIEDVDESENIAAYISRMVSLKQGGHLPRLNIDAVESLLPTEDLAVNATEDIEVDIDVGYVNKSLDASFDVPCDQTEADSCVINYDDALSYASSTLLKGGGGGNRYEPIGYENCSDDEEDDDDDDTHEAKKKKEKKKKKKKKGDAFESLLVGGAGSRHVRWEKSGIPGNKAEKHAKKDRKKKEKKSSSKPSSSSSSKPSPSSPRVHDSTDKATEEDWAGVSDATYGYQKERDAWSRKREIALWHTKNRHHQRTLIFDPCHDNAMEVALEEIVKNGLPIPLGPPPRLRGITAVKRLEAKAPERIQRRTVTNLMRNVPMKHIEAQRSWQMTYRDRCRANPGYVGVDQFSLLDSTCPQQKLDSRDGNPWESREVKQHFLHEESVAFSKNWFGRLRRKRGNDPVKYRPVRPRSMEMPMDRSESSDSSDDECDSTDDGKNDKLTTVLKKGLEAFTPETVALSFFGGKDDDDDCDGDDESFTHHTPSSASLTTGRTGQDATSTIFTADGTSSFFGQSKLGEKASSGIISLDADEVGSSGVSAILDENSDDDDDVFSGLSVDRQHEEVNISFPSVDRYHVASLSVTVRSDCSHSGVSESMTSSHDDSSSGSSGSYGDSSITSSSGSFCSSDESSSFSSCYSDGSWEENPECGTLVNVKPKLGERASRVTPDHTSHLLRSRFRKKFFPRGTFPYDKKVV